MSTDTPSTPPAGYRDASVYVSTNWLVARVRVPLSTQLIHYKGVYFVRRWDSFYDVGVEACEVTSECVLREWGWP